MLDDFVPLTHTFSGRTVKVWPIADVHIGSKECDLDGFKAVLRQIMSDDDAYLVLCGDILDNAVCSPASVFQGSPSEAMETAVKLIKPLADSGKILGMVSGNHEQRTSRLADVDISEVLAYRLGVQDVYRQNMAFVRINLKGNGTQDTYNLLLMHGASKSRKDRFHVEGVDAFISGHVHDPYVGRNARLVFSQKGRVSVEPIVHVTCCSFLNYGGYGAAKMYPVKATSCPQCLELEFTNSNNSKGKMRVIW